MTESAGRKLVLLRHAKSAWPDLPDHERPLAGRGRRDAPVMGRWLRTAGHVPDQVLCSTARRARETWQLAQPGLGAAPPVSFEDRVYGASAAQLLDLARHAPPAVKTLLIVGHDPGIPGLALLAGAAAPADGAEESGAVFRRRLKLLQVHRKLADEMLLGHFLLHGRGSGPIGHAAKSARAQEAAAPVGSTTGVACATPSG